MFSIHSLLAIVIGTTLFDASAFGDPARDLIILTDMEPDDRIALTIVAARKELYERLLFVGTTLLNTKLKEALVRRQLKLSGLEKVPVYEGTGGPPSSYPNNVETAKAALRFWHEEGNGILADWKLKEFRGDIKPEGDDSIIADEETIARLSRLDDFYSIVIEGMIESRARKPQDRHLEDHENVIKLLDMLNIPTPPKYVYRIPKRPGILTEAPRSLKVIFPIMLVTPLVMIRWNEHHEQIQTKWAKFHEKTRPKSNFSTKLAIDFAMNRKAFEEAMKRFVDRGQMWFHHLKAVDFVENNGISDKAVKIKEKIHGSSVENSINKQNADINQKEDGGGTKVDRNEESSPPDNMRKIPYEFLIKEEDERSILIMGIPEYTAATTNKDQSSSPLLQSQRYEHDYEAVMDILFAIGVEVYPLAIRRFGEKIYDGGARHVQVIFRKKKFVKIAVDCWARLWKNIRGIKEKPHWKLLVIRAFVYKRSTVTATEYKIKNKKQLLDMLGFLEDIPGHAVKQSNQTDNNVSKNDNALQRALVKTLSTAKDDSIEILLMTAPIDLVHVLVKAPKLIKKIRRVHLMGGWVELKKPREPKDYEVPHKTTQQPLPPPPPTIWGIYNLNMAPESSKRLFAMASKNGEEALPLRLYTYRHVWELFNSSINRNRFNVAIDRIKKSKSPVMEDFLKAAKSWDEHAMRVMPYLTRFIGPYAGEQFSPADPILVVGLLNPEAFIKEKRKVKVNVKFEQIEIANDVLEVQIDYDNPNSKIELITGLTGHILREELDRSVDKHCFICHMYGHFRDECPKRNVLPRKNTVSGHKRPSHVEDSESRNKIKGFGELSHDSESVHRTNVADEKSKHGIAINESLMKENNNAKRTWAGWGIGTGSSRREQPDVLILAGSDKKRDDSMFDMDEFPVLGSVIGHNHQRDRGHQEDPQHANHQNVQNKITIKVENNADEMIKEEDAGRQPSNGIVREDLQVEQDQADQFNTLEQGEHDEYDTTVATDAEEDVEQDKLKASAEAIKKLLKIPESSEDKKDNTMNMQDAEQRKQEAIGTDTELKIHKHEVDDNNGDNKKNAENAEQRKQKTAAEDIKQLLKIHKSSEPKPGEASTEESIQHGEERENNLHIDTAYFGNLNEHSDVLPPDSVGPPVESIQQNESRPQIHDHDGVGRGIGNGHVRSGAKTNIDGDTGSVSYKSISGDQSSFTNSGHEPREPLREHSDNGFKLDLDHFPPLATFKKRNQQDEGPHEHPQHGVPQWLSNGLGVNSPSHEKRNHGTSVDEAKLNSASNASVKRGQIAAGQQMDNQQKAAMTKKWYEDWEEAPVPMATAATDKLHIVGPSDHTVREIHQKNLVDGDKNHLDEDTTEGNDYADKHSEVPGMLDQQINKKHGDRQGVGGGVSGGNDSGRVNSEHEYLVDYTGLGNAIAEKEPIATKDHVDRHRKAAPEKPDQNTVDNENVVVKRILPRGKTLEELLAEKSQTDQSNNRKPGEQAHRKTHQKLEPLKEHDEKSEIKKPENEEQGNEKAPVSTAVQPLDTHKPGETDENGDKKKLDDVANNDNEKKMVNTDGKNKEEETEEQAKLGITHKESKPGHVHKDVDVADDQYNPSELDKIGDSKIPVDATTKENIKHDGLPPDFDGTPEVQPADGHRQFQATSAHVFGRGNMPHDAHTNNGVKDGGIVPVLTKLAGVTGGVEGNEEQGKISAVPKLDDWIQFPPLGAVPVKT